MFVVNKQPFYVRNHSCLKRAVLYCVNALARYTFDLAFLLRTNQCKCSKHNQLFLFPDFENIANGSVLGIL